MKSALRYAMALIAALLLSSTFAIAPAAAQHTGHVYLLRGLANVFSMGMDTLAEKLNARGITATVHEYGTWQQLADQAAAESRANRNAPIIIVGHSLGADAAVEMAERLTALGRPPRLVVTFDPVGVSTVGRSSGTFINYYQSNNGYGKRLATGAGFSGRLYNHNLNGASGLDHFNIEKAPSLHAKVIATIESLTVVRRSKPRPAVAKPAEPTAPATPAASAPSDKAAAKPETATASAAKSL